MVDKEDIINSVRLHNAVNSIIREYGYTVKPVKVKPLKYTSVIEGKERVIIGYTRSFYRNDFLVPHVFIASRYKKKTEDMVNALKLINAEVSIEQTKEIIDTLNGWWKCKMKW
jgi:hypothetical protein